MRSRVRARVIVDNDFSGDPDDLFALAHHVASPTVDVSLVIGSHLSPDDGHDASRRQADNAADVALSALAVMGRDSVPVVAGSNVALRRTEPPAMTAAAQAIIAEAMRDASDLPLYFAAGGGLTDLATAWLLEPRIANKLTLVWVGGAEYEGQEPPPGSTLPEYNTAIDVYAAQVIFNESAIPIIQVPRAA